MKKKKKGMRVSHMGVSNPFFCGEQHQRRASSLDFFSRVKLKENERGALGSAFPRGAAEQERSDQVKGKAYGQPGGRIFLAASLFISYRKELGEPQASPAS